VNAAMLERAYRQRLEADLARWQADGVITPATGTAIRHSLPPVGTGLNIAVVVGIVDADGVVSAGRSVSASGGLGRHA
jgi:hypothetical protein